MNKKSNKKKELKTGQGISNNGLKETPKFCHCGMKFHTASFFKKHQLQCAKRKDKYKKGKLL